MRRHYKDVNNENGFFTVSWIASVGRGWLNSDEGRYEVTPVELIELQKFICHEAQIDVSLQRLINQGVVVRSAPTYPKITAEYRLATPVEIAKARCAGLI